MERYRNYETYFNQMKLRIILITKNTLDDPTVKIANSYLQYIKKTWNPCFWPLTALGPHCEDHRN